MRIGIVTFELDRQTGGVGQWCWQFVHALAQREHEVHIIAQRFGETLLAPQIVRHIIPATKSRIAFAGAAAQLLSTLKLDVVHDMGAGWSCDIFQPHGGSHVAWLARKADMHAAPWLKRRIDAVLPRQRDFLRHCRRQFAPREQADKTFVALSKAVADDFVRLHGIRTEQIALVYNGVDCSRFSPEHRATHRAAVRRQLGVDDETLLLLLAAHNFRLKGVPELIEVAARLVANQRQVHVAVAGGHRLAKWRGSAARWGIANRVTFVGTASDLVPYYAAADAYVHPTYYDACSLVLLEAAASGLPIVTTRRHNGAAELFRDGHEILKVNDPSDSDALYERVESLIHEGVRQQLGAAAREVALRHPFERNVAKIVRLYERPHGRRQAA